MIDLPELLVADRICCHCTIHSKKRALQTVAELLGTAFDDEQMSDMDILDALIGRERLGSTGLGYGVALPHSRMENIEKPLAAMITLNDGVDFEAADDKPVDLVFGLLVPQECNDEHLKILAQLARRFSDADLRATLRSFATGDALFDYLKNLPPANQ